MAIAGKPAARSLKTKGTTMKHIASSGASTKTKNAFKKMSADKKKGFKK